MAERTISVIDIGSNTIKILVAQKGEQKPLKVLFKAVEECRISTGIGEAGTLFFDNPCMEKACFAVSRLRDQARPFAPDETLIVGTSALRDAQNQDDFIKAIYRKTGIHLKILSGKEEVDNIFRGILCDPHLQAISDFIILDIGGGSIELCEVKNRKSVQTYSYPLGAVRLTEKFIANPKNPINPSVLNSISQYIIAKLEQSRWRLPPKPLALIGSGGVFAITKAVLAERHPDHQNWEMPLSLKNIRTFSEELTPMSLPSRCQIPQLPANRADIFPTALTIVDSIGTYLQSTSIRPTLYNLRYGIATKWLEEH